MDLFRIISLGVLGLLISTGASMSLVNEDNLQVAPNDVFDFKLPVFEGYLSCTFSSSLPPFFEMMTVDVMSRDGSTFDLYILIESELNHMLKHESFLSLAIPAHSP